MNKRTFHLLIGVIIVVLSLFYAFKGVSLDELIDALIKAEYIYLIPAILIMIGSYILRAMRWRILVGTVKDVSTVRLFSPLMIGFMANMLPARAGEFIRAYLLSKKESISFSSSFATIFIERLFDLLLVLLLLVGVLLFMPGTFSSPELASSVKIFGFTSLGLFVFIFAFSAFLQYKYDLTMKIVSLFIRPLPKKIKDKIIRMIQSFREGLQIIRNTKGFIATVLLSFLIWMSFIMLYYPLYFAFGIEGDLPIVSSLVVLCVTVAIFITVAPTPGFLGSYQLGCVAALHGIFGIQKAVAVSYSMVAWLVGMGCTIIIGTFFALKENVSLTSTSFTKEPAD